MTHKEEINNLKEDFFLITKQYVADRVKLDAEIRALKDNNQELALQSLSSSKDFMAMDKHANILNGRLLKLGTQFRELADAGFNHCHDNDVWKQVVKAIQFK